MKALSLLLALLAAPAFSSPVEFTYIGDPLLSPCYGTCKSDEYRDFAARSLRTYERLYYSVSIDAEEYGVSIDDGSFTLSTYRGRTEVTLGNAAGTYSESGITPSEFTNYHDPAGYYISLSFDSGGNVSDWYLETYGKSYWMSSSIGDTFYTWTFGTRYTGLCMSYPPSGICPVEDWVYETWEWDWQYSGPAGEWVEGYRTRPVPIAPALPAFAISLLFLRNLARSRRA